MGTKLNIGAGDTVIDGWTPIDRKLGSEAYPLPYADNSVEEIRASHLLEHFSFDDAAEALKEWVRVLQPGGRLRVAVPDMDKVLSMHSDPKRRFYLMGGQTTPDDYHRSCWDRQTLTRYLTDAGLVDVAPWESPNTDSAALPVSLNLEGVKSSAPSASLPTVKMRAVMSLPRVGWNDAWGQVFEALRPWNIPVSRFTGAFWEQCIQTAFSECVKDGVDWIVSIDYDSLFSAEHVDRLIGYLGTMPEIDAIAALQARRDSLTPLLTTTAKDGRVEVRMNEPIKARTAHFGLTLIRVEALKKVPKPWFWSQPGKDGEWDEETKIDADIWFWKQWEKAGNTVYVAPDVRIGHLELRASEFDENMEPRMVTVGDWRRANKGSFKRY